MVNQEKLLKQLRESHKPVGEMEIDELEVMIKTNCHKNQRVDPQMCKECKGCALGCNLIERLNGNERLIEGTLRFDREKVARDVYDMETRGAGKQDIFDYLKTYYKNPSSSYFYIKKIWYPKFEDNEELPTKPEMNREERKQKPVEVQPEEKPTEKPVETPVVVAEVKEPVQMTEKPTKRKLRVNIEIDGDINQYRVTKNGIEVTNSKTGAIVMTKDEWLAYMEEIMDAISELEQYTA